MSEQKSLFGVSNHDGQQTFKAPTTQTKRCHSKTSFDAAAKLDASKEKEQQIDDAEWIVHKFPGCTAKEVMDYAKKYSKFTGEQIRKRLADVKNYKKTITDDEDRRRDGCKTWWPV